MKKEQESAVELWIYHGYYMRRLRNHGYGNIVVIVRAIVTMVTVENPLITLRWINIRIFRYYYESVIQTMIPMWERTMTYRDVVF